MRSKSEMSTGKECRNLEQSLEVPRLGAEHLRRHSWDCNTASEEVIGLSSPSTCRKRLPTNSEGKEVPPVIDAKRTLPWWNMSAFRKVFTETTAEKTNASVEKVEDIVQPEDPTSDNLLNGREIRSNTILKRREGRASLSSQQRSQEQTENVPHRRVGIGNWISEAAPRVWTNFTEQNAERCPNDGKPIDDEPGRERRSMISIARRGMSRDGDDRAKNRRATVHYSSTGRPSVMGSKRRTMRAAHLAKEDRVKEQIKDICRDYVVYRLRRKSLVNKVKLNRNQQTINRWVIEDALFVVNELERTNKHLYRNISKQVGVTLRSEDVLRKLFSELSMEILTTQEKPQDELETGVVANEPSLTEVRKSSFSRTRTTSRQIEITWGRIFAVVAIAGGLAVDCVQQGHSDLVNSLIDYCGEFAHEEGILGWIVSAGGLEALHKVAIDDERDNCQTDYGYFTRLCNMALAFVFCALAAVLAAAVIGSVFNTFL